MGGIRQNAKENGQIRLPDCRWVVWKVAAIGTARQSCGKA
jgi:hypothetical protein